MHRRLEAGGEKQLILPDQNVGKVPMADCTWMYLNETAGPTARYHRHRRFEDGF